METVLSKGKAGIALNVLAILFSAAVFAQSGVAYTVEGTQAQSCQGQNMKGAWMTDETWEETGGIEIPPGEDDGFWPGRKIVIRHDIIVCNNFDIDLRDSNLDTIEFRNGASLHFRANGALLLPLNTVIVMEDNSSFYTTNNSQGTLLMIGIDSVWGQTIRCIPDVHGPRVITQESELCAEELLPVELVSFEVEPSDKGARLNWVTASEINSDYFEIQRSADGLAWEALDRVFAAGRSVDKLEYTWVDESPVYGTSYYRLKQVDLDGTYEYLPVRAYRTNLTAAVEARLVNPVRNDLNLSLYAKQQAANKEVDIIVYNLFGRMIGKFGLTLQEGQNEIVIPMGDQDQGSYFVTAMWNDQVMLSDRFVLVR